MDWIQRTDKYYDFEKRSTLNLQDKDGITVLHIAVSNNQREMIKRLTESKKVDRNRVNQSGFTALVVLEVQAPVDRESVNILKRAKDPPLRFRRVSYLAKFGRDIEEMKPDAINALLVVFALILLLVLLLASLKCCLLVDREKTAFMLPCPSPKMPPVPVSPGHPLAAAFVLFCFL
ncbi:Uncharacterized protein TCM_042980 [Theobroma cacao]|uniref:Uncharacterized protein n=1 Tax=Theobroma cacao TaxID=3641 RepID=A0A061FMS6_THECC|nr:Uncharacterized protein TCM_042980 [Theobroma cacao]